MALWGSPRLHTRPGLPPAHLGSGLQAPSASGRPQAQRLVSVTASERSYTPLAHDGCREWEGGASPSMSLHSREKKPQRKKKKEPKKSPEKLLLKESTKSQPFREAEWDEARFSLGSTAARPDRSHLSSPRLPRRQPPAGCCCCGSNQATSGPLRFGQGMLHHRPAKAH